MALKFEEFTVPDTESTLSEYERQFLFELWRYAMLNDRKWNMNCEHQVILNSIWRMLNPLGLPDRERHVLEFDGIKGIDGTEGKYITIHAHENEPLGESPDDILMYYLIGLHHSNVSHYIVDKFKVVKVK